LDGNDLLYGGSNDDTLFRYAPAEENRKIIEQNSMRVLGLNGNSLKVVPMARQGSCLQPLQAFSCIALRLALQ